MDFNPRPPSGERPGIIVCPKSLKLFQSTPPERGATKKPYWSYYGYYISIHAPRAGSDCRECDFLTCIPNFNPRPPSGERRHLTPKQAALGTFQSTPPERGATFYIHLYSATSDISIHAPRAGSDTFVIGVPSSPTVFQSTPPERGATELRRERLLSEYISIHAPRAGSDHYMMDSYSPQKKFQSTPPERGATMKRNASDTFSCISIHAPRAGSD